MIYIDVIALVIIGIFTLSGLRRGFTKTFFSTFGTLLSLLLAVALAGKVASFVESKFSLVTSLSNSLSGVLTNIFGDTIMNTTLEQVTTDQLSDAGLAGFIIKIVLSLQTNNEIPMDVTLNQVIAPIFGYYICLIIAVILLMIIFKIIFYIVGEIISNSKSFNLLTGVDKLLGVALGLIQGIINVELIIMIIAVIPLGFCQQLIAEIATAPFTNFINNINLFNLILSSISFADITGFITGLFG